MSHRFKKILEYTAYSLAFAVWTTVAIKHGDLFFNILNGPGFVDKRFVFFMVLLGNFLTIGAIIVINRSLKVIFPKLQDAGKEKPGLFLMSSFSGALVFIVYTYTLFSTSGGWIVSGGRGISGGLSNFWIDLVVYSLIAMIVKWIFLVKDRLDKRLNTSVILLLLAIIVSADGLQTIF